MITGELRPDLVVNFKGKNTSTSNTTVDVVNREISVDVKRVPHTFIIKQGDEVVAFDGSEDKTITIEASPNAVNDVKVNNISVVDANKVANIDLTPYATTQALNNEVGRAQAQESAISAIVASKADQDSVSASFQQVAIALDGKQSKLPNASSSGKVLKSTDTPGTYEWGDAAGGGADNIKYDAKPGTFGTVINPTGSLTTLYLNADVNIDNAVSVLEGIILGEGYFAFSNAGITQYISFGSLGIEGVVGCAVFGKMYMFSTTNASIEGMNIPRGVSLFDDEQMSFTLLSGIQTAYTGEAVQGVSGEGVGTYNNLLTEMLSFNNEFVIVTGTEGFTLYQGSTPVAGQTNKVKLKTVNNNSILGEGNIATPEINDNETSANKCWSSQKTNTELTNVREVAEGKCKSFTLSYADKFSTIPSGSYVYLFSYNSTTHKWEKTEITTEIGSGNYVDANVLNASFNSTNDFSYNQSETKYIIFRYIAGIDAGNYFVVEGSQYSTYFNNGDVILVVETNVPDRWFGKGIVGTFYQLETKTTSIPIDDTTTANNKVWSSNKTNTEISKVRTIALSGAKHISVNTNVSAIEEVSYSMHIVYKMDGTRLTTWQDFVDFVVNGNPMATPTLKNSAFNSNDNNILANATYGDYLIVNISGNTYYVISLSALKISESEYGFDMQTLKQMDLFILGSQQNIPDRFIDFSNNNLLGFKALEGKVQSMTFATGTNQGQFKANNVDYSVNGLGTSDSPSFAGVKNNNYTHASKVFKITYSDDSVENVSFLAYAIPPASYTITNTLSNCSNSNNATTINEGQNYTATLTANNGYVMSSVAITKGTTDITATAYNSSTGAINISSVDGNISITATARLLATYTITNNLTHTNNSNTATSITEGYSYNGTLSAESGYEISSVLIKVNGVNKTSEVYNASTGAISISGVNGNIEITAISINISEYSITNNLTGVQTNNPSTTISTGASYSATLSVIDEGETIRRCSVYMGSENITSTAYDSSTGEITIDSVSGNVVITASTQTGRLPAGYTEVAYLVLNGNQYIDTGLLPIASAGYIKLKYQLTSRVSKQTLFGSYNPRFYVADYYGTGGSIYGIADEYSDTQDILSTDVIDQLTYTISADGKTLTLNFLNNTYTVSGTDLNYVNNIYLGGRNQGGLKYGFNGYLGEFEYYSENDGLLAKYVPCRRDSDSKPGFYDLVSNTFKTNDGTGADFTLGPDVN